MPLPVPSFDSCQETSATCTLYGGPPESAVKQLELDGWVQVRQRGSHRQFRHPSKTGTVTVAGKESADVPAGTLNSVLKHAGLKQAARADGCSEEDDA